MCQNTPFSELCVCSKSVKIALTNPNLIKNFRYEKSDITQDNEIKIPGGTL